MYAIDLFEAEQQSGYVPVNPERPGSRHRKLGNLNLDAIKASFAEAGTPKPATLHFLNGTSKTLTSEEVDAVADYYDTLKTKVEKANFIYRTFISQDKMANLLFKLKQLNLDLQPPREPDAGPEQLTLFQEKKSFDKTKYKDVGVQRAVRQAQADFPTAASDEEAFIKSMMVQQDQDQKNIDRLKTGLGRQKDLLNKNTQLDQTQDQTINDLNKEIHSVEKDNDNLQLSLQQMQRANAELQQTLDRMRGKRVEPAPQLGVSVATDKQPAITVQQTTPVPANVATRQDLARLAQRQRQQRLAGKTTKQLAQPDEKSVGTAQIGGQDVEVLPSIKKAKVPSSFRQTAMDVPDAIKQEDLTHGLEEGSVFGQQDFDTQMDLAKLKSKLTQPKAAQSAPASTAQAQSQSQPVPARLSDLQARHQRVEALAKIKGEIEAMQQKATKGGRILPRGLAADLEDYYTLADVDRYYDEIMAKYQKQLAALEQYTGMKKILNKKVTHEMKVKELEESKSEVWTVHFTDGTAVRVRVTDETDPAVVRKHYANKGKTVAKFDYGYGVEPESGPGPEAHEPGSGRAVSARTGERLPEDAKLDRSGQKMYQAQEAYMIVHNGKEVAFYKPSEMKQAYADAEGLAKKFGGEVHVRKVMREGRAGYNPLTSEKHWHEVERYLSSQINDPKLDPESKAEARQRYAEKRREAQQKGWAK